MSAEDPLTDDMRADGWQFTHIGQPLNQVPAIRHAVACCTDGACGCPCHQYAGRHRISTNWRFRHVGRFRFRINARGGAFR